MIKRTFVWAALLAAGLTAIPARAVEPEELEEGYGQIVDVIKDGGKTTGLVINGLDYDTGEETETTYALDKGIALEGVKKVEDLAAGQDVEFSFSVRAKGPPLMKRLALYETNDEGMDEIDPQDE